MGSMTDQPLPDRPDEVGPATADASAFTELGLAGPLTAGLAQLGYEEPTPIQREAIPPLLAGNDILAEAPTGTGKTAAFALPMLQRLDGGVRGAPSAPRGLVLVPTRELAMQVAEAIHRYGQPFGLRVLPVYGGQAIGQQTRVLRHGVDIVVATPGRAVDHLTRGPLTLDAVEMVVLDEADEMLDMGFAEDLDAILSATPQGRQTALFSATISPPIARIARKHLREPVRVTIRPERRGDDDGAERVRQVVYVVRRADKSVALGRILDLEDPASALVFARTRGEVDELAERLAAHGHDVAAIHGGLTQEQRDRVMGRFREGALDVLVATDVAARGLDIEHVSHVVNFDIPSNPDAYVHRTGRTGRAGRTGVAITLVEPREQRLLRNIENAIGRRLEIAPIPTVTDLRERRLSSLEGRLRERIAAGDLERYEAIVEGVAEDGPADGSGGSEGRAADADDGRGPVAIAAAALALADEASGRTSI
jgi:ATP-dependent RNA helicase DeaD